MIDLTSRVAKLSPSKRDLLAERIAASPEAAEPIAIVGMGCRFAGARNVQELWRLIKSGEVAIGEVPPTRWDADEFYDEDFDAVGKMATRWGGFIDDVDQFDPQFFGITPREAERMDPQQRLLLEVVWEALEHACIAPDRVRGGATGVFVGIGGSDYSKVVSRSADYLDYVDAHVGTGNALSIAANRISYVFDFHGPSLAVDTACSSGMVGIHTAVQSLRNWECDAALAGGVNLILAPDVTIAFSKARMLSTTGRCRPFDAAANGYVRGEGCAMLVLKRLTDAVRDQDNVLAIIRGAAVNQDGRTSGITAPNSLYQEAAIRSALDEAGLSPDDVTYIEAHGTATPLGDPIEVQSLAEVFQRRSDELPPVYVSSVKANIGHTETVSGVAGVIKTVLLMQHGQIVPQTLLEEVNPRIELEGTRLKFPTEVVTWDASRPRIAGVSSFGFGGTNSHLVLEAAQPREPEAIGSERPLHLLPISAKSNAALAAVAGRYAEFLKDNPGVAAADLCHSAAVGRSHFNHRLAIVAEARDGFIEKLTSVAEGKNAGAKIGHVSLAARPRLAFLFTGQGSQYAGMGRELYESQPVFRRAIDRCDELLVGLLEKSLVSVLLDKGEDSPINETAYTQPTLFAIEFALTALWRSWGIEPDVVMGHSIGEYVAAVTAGVMSLQDGLRLVAHRGRLMQALPRTGAMAVIFAPRDKVEEALAGLEQSVSIAAANGPENTVISGETGMVDRLIEKFKNEGVSSERLTVSHAFHSPLMAPMLDEFERLAGEVEYRRPRVTIISNVTGKQAADGDYSARYWRDHVRGAVCFEQGVNSVQEHGVDVVLEIGPAPVLLGMARRCLPDSQATWLPSMRKGQSDLKVMLGTLADLYVAGVNVNWAGFDADWPRRRLALPHYPFERSRVWMDAGQGDRVSAGGTGPKVHPLLGRRVPSALESTLYEAPLGARSPKYLADHQVQGSPVTPAAAYIEQGLAAAAQAFGPGRHAVQDVSIQQAMFLPEQSSRTVQVTVSPELGGRCTFETYSIAADGDGGWQMHATGTLVHGAAETEETPTVDLEALRSQATGTVERGLFYQQMAARGLAYGPAFQVLDEITYGPDAAVARVQLTDDVIKESGQYHLHPALLDACMQGMATAIPPEADGSQSRHTYMPTGVGRLLLFGDPQEEMYVCVKRNSAEAEPSPEVVEADVLLTDSTGRVLVELSAVRVQRLGAAGAKTADPRDWLYEIQWRNAPLTASSDAEATEKPPMASNGAATNSAHTQGCWLVFADQQNTAKSLVKQLDTRGERAILVRPGSSFAHDGECFTVDPLCADDYQRLFEVALGGEVHGCRGVVYMWSLDIPTPERAPDSAFDQSRQLGCGGALRLIQQLAKSRLSRTPQLWLVTRGAQAIDADLPPCDDEFAVAQTPLWGLGRVAALEHPELRTRLIDLDPALEAGLCVEQLTTELTSEAEENQVAYRAGERWVARLTPTPDAVPKQEDTGTTQLPAEGPFRIRLGKPGSIDSLRVESFKREAPEAGQVELEVRAAGLNFSDVLKAMGLYPGIKDKVVPLGIECSGVVTAVGAGITRFMVGDAVLGVAPYSFASHARTAEFALVPKPSGISDAEACTIPITFLTAYYALVRLAQLQPGERVLIHAGAGGVGLAAIQIARRLGAEVFATAGSDEKRAYLRSLGVEHVMNSRTLDFAKEIGQVTAHAGVDVVLNSLPGEAIDKSLASLAAYGRFCEIGKTDIYMNRKIGLLPFQDNLSYFAIDLDRMLRQRPDYMQGLFAEMMGHFESGDYRPLEFTRFPIDETEEAFRYMAQRKNIGKVVLSLDGAERRRDPGVAQDKFIRADGAYLVTGGLGALGLRVAEWLANEGAGRVLLMSRSEPTGEKLTEIARLREGGAEIVVVCADVTDADSLTDALAAVSSEAPLRGVFHAAGVLDDGLIFDMDLERLDRAMRPKVQGAWNLHTATRGDQLDLFVMFSSIACVIGSPGQANYAAGNAFLDGLAAYRRGLGLPAVSVNWGPWAEGGMAAQGDNAVQLAARGMNLLPADECLQLLRGLIEQGRTQTAVVSARWRDMLRNNSADVPPLLRDLAPLDEAPTESLEDSALRSALVVADPATRRGMLIEHFTEQLATIMGLAPEEIDSAAPLNTMGLDSLMAIELKNTIETRLTVVLPMARFMEGPSVTTLAEAVSDMLGHGAPAAASPNAALTPGVGAGGRHPLSHGQRALWFLYQLAPHSSAYNICDAVRVHGPLDLDALGRALQRVVDRHAMMRATFHAEDGRPYQVVHDDWEVEFNTVDAAGWNEEQIKQRLADEVHSPFDLENGPLLRVVSLREGEDRCLLIFAVHHIIADFWSMVSVTDEFKQLYAAEIAGVESGLPPIRVEYDAFTRWQQEMLDGPEGRQHWDYWKERLGGSLPILDLPTDKPRPPVQTYGGDLAFHFVRPELTARLKRLGDAHGATLNMVLLSAYELLLARYTGQSDILVGTPTAGRTRADLARVVGYFVNPVVIRGDLSADPTGAAFLEQIRDRTLESFDHQDYPFSLLVERLQPPRDASRSPLFQTMFAMQKAHVMHDEGLTPFMMGQSGAEITFAGLRFESTTLEQWIAQFEVSLVASEADDGVSLMLQYNTDLFERETVELMLQHYERLLNSLVDDPTQPASALVMLSEEEREKLLHQWSGKDRSHELARIAKPDRDQTVAQRFEAHAARRGDAVAAVDGGNSWTYRELNERANRIAHLLQSRGVGPGDVVGLCFERSREAIATLLGVAKSGGAYLPIDPRLPADRIAHMLKDSGARAVVANSENASRLAGVSPEVLLLDELEEILSQASPKNPDPQAGQHDLAYVIYTSGSTGEAKGTMVEHGGLAALYRAWECDFQLTENDTHLQMAGLSFDVFTGDVTRTLCSGAKLVLCPTETLLDPPRLYDLMRDTGVNCAEFVPAVLRLLMQRLRDTSQTLGFLRLLVVGSDVWYMSDHRVLLGLCAPDASVYNGYGVTEATIDSTYFESTGVDLAADAIVPIGRPFSGCLVFVLDARLNLAATGAVGELCIGGPGVARGYLNRPELTAERFISPAWLDGERLYRTGDLVRFLPDGNLEFLGRSDYQVKLNGFRIELGEIETALARHEGVRQAVVHPWQDAAGQKRLAAYVIAEADAPDATDLRAFLQQSLPDYMIPSAFVTLDQLPLSPNGKVDRKALPEPVATRPDLRAGYVAPRNAAELRLEAIWEEVLGVEPIGMRDNFFDLGGHSLLAVQLISRVNRELGRSMPLATLLRNGTIERMAVLSDQADENQPYTPLTPLRPHGELPPLFCLHPAGGNVLCYHELTHALDHQRPVFALEARGGDGKLPPHATLDEMVDDYLTAIRGAQPQGPYHLLGWSSGGVLAYEIARRLDAASEPVAPVLLIDSRVMSQLDIDPSDECLILATLADFLTRFYGFNLAVTQQELAPLSPEDRFELLVNRAKTAGQIPLDLTTGELRTFVDVARANLQVVHNYTPPQSDLAVCLFRAAVRGEEADHDPRPDLGWGEVTRSLEVREATGDHITMMTGHNVEQLARSVDEVLNRFSSSAH